MGKPSVKFRERLHNAALLNAIRNEASHPYQERIPAATKANYLDAANKILNYKPAQNEAIDALVNLIGLVKFQSDSYFQNPLAKFKQGTLDNGDTVEEVGLGLLNAYAYDARKDVLEGELFGQEDVEAQTSYHRINRQEKYKVTIQRPMLKRALLAEYGLSELVSRLMDLPQKSNQWDEFISMANLFKLYDAEDGFFRVNVPDVMAGDSTEQDAKLTLRAIRQMTDTLPFPSRNYNASGLPVSTTPDQLELFITPEANSAIDVNGLAAAFNIDRAQVSSRQTIIPAEYFPVGVVAILTTRDFFQVYDTLMESTSLNNPGGLYDNYWLHVHQIISMSRFVPAVAFTTGPGTIIDDTVYNVTSLADIVTYDRDGLVDTGELERGQFYRVTSSAITTPAGGPNNAVRWEVAGFTDPHSFIDQNGTLYPSPFERADEVIVTAYATDNESVTKVQGYDLKGDIVSLWNPIDVLPDPAATP
jgi:hypothetical protein